MITLWLDTGAPTALVSRRSRRLPSGLRSDHWPIVIGDFIELFGDAHSEDFPDLQELERISTPILLVHGDRDHHFAPEIACALYRKLRSAELCVLPNTGHWPPSEQPEIFNLLAADFLTRTGEPFGSCRVVPREDRLAGIGSAAPSSYGEPYVARAVTAPSLELREARGRNGDDMSNQPRVATACSYPRASRKERP